VDPKLQKAARTAERLSRLKGRMIGLQAVLFIAWQGLYFSTNPGGELVRTVDRVQLASWLVWVVALMAFLATGGGWIWGRDVRRLLNDEMAVHNRREGQRAGFWGAMAASLLIYAISFYEPLEPREAVHLILSLSIGVALVRYGWLERRAEREG
jgi:hypothetical protein